MFASTTALEECSIIELLHRVDIFLQKYVNKRNINGIEDLAVRQIAFPQSPYLILSSQQILTALLGSRQTQHAFAAILYSQLVKNYSPSALKQLIDRWSIQPSFSPSSLSLSSLIKDIRQQILLIKDELFEFKDTLKEVDFKERKSDGEKNERECLWGLLRIVMEESEMDLEESLSGMLLRLYILVESISQVFSKTKKVIEIAQDRALNHERRQHASTNSQQSQKRSALSASLQIFKERQHQEEKPRSQKRFFHKSSLIKTDYSPQKIRERTVKSSQPCCFRF